MKFAIINDVHIGEYRQNNGIYRKANINAENLLKDFVDNMNKSFKPDFVVQGGDLIQDTSPELDKINYIKGLKVLEKLKCPVYHLVGNHELKNLDEAFLKDALNYKKLYFNIDSENFRFIFLFTKRYYPSKDIKLGSAQLKWLGSKVKTHKKIIIFSHHSPIPVDTKGNFWFEDRPDLTYIKDYDKFLDIIKNTNVKLVFNGHLHWNQKNVFNGVNYITIQSLVENTSDQIEGPPANAYALVNLEDAIATIDITGQDGLNYSVKI